LAAVDLPEALTYRPDPQGGQTSEHGCDPGGRPAGKGGDPDAHLEGDHDDESGSTGIAYPSGGQSVEGSQPTRTAVAATSDGACQLTYAALAG
jgi:hypothetical protein